MQLFISGFGSKVTPRIPFLVTFRPPQMAIENAHGAVMFGPTAEGSLGFSPVGDTALEDVTLDVETYPRAEQYAVHTELVRFPIGQKVRLHSTPAETPWPFELSFEGARDADEMLHLRGPFGGVVDASRIAGPKAVDSGRVERPDGFTSWSELAYAVSGVPFRQRLYGLSLASTHTPGSHAHFLLTAQCREARTRAVFGFADRLAAAIMNAQ